MYTLHIDARWQLEIVVTTNKLWLNNYLSISKEMSHLPIYLSINLSLLTEVSIHHDVHCMMEGADHDDDDDSMTYKSRIQTVECPSTKHLIARFRIAQITSGAPRLLRSPLLVPAFLLTSRPPYIAVTPVRESAARGAGLERNRRPAFCAHFFP